MRRDVYVLRSVREKRAERGMKGGGTLRCSERTRENEERGMRQTIQQYIVQQLVSRKTRVLYHFPSNPATLKYIVKLSLTLFLLSTRNGEREWHAKAVRAR